MSKENFDNAMKKIGKSIAAFNTLSVLPIGAALMREAARLEELEVKRGLDLRYGTETYAGADLVSWWVEKVKKDNDLAEGLIIIEDMIKEIK